VDQVKHHATVDHAALQQCVRALQRQNPVEAERIARQILARDARQIDALFFLGVALLTQRRPAEAVAPLEASAAMRANAEVETNLAIALRDSGRPQEALARFEHATKQMPPFAPAFLEYGATLRAMRRNADAEIMLRRANQLAPDNSLINLILGAVLLNRANPQGAREAFEHVLARLPGHPEGLFGLGVTCLNEGRFADGAEQFRAIIAQEPRHVRAWLHLAHALMELSRWDEALICLRKAIEIDPASRGNAIRMLVSAGRGRFWLKRSTLADVLGVRDKL
jgi:tetratricopeptide (TPR) repeat protein